MNRPRVLIRFGMLSDNDQRKKDWLLLASLVKLRFFWPGNEFLHLPKRKKEKKKGKLMKQGVGFVVKVDENLSVFFFFLRL